MDTDKQVSHGVSKGYVFLALLISIFFAVLPFIQPTITSYFDHSLFLGYGDHPRYMSASIFVGKDFVNPYGERPGSLVGDPDLGSTPLNVAVGFISLYTGIAVPFLFILAQITASALALFCAYLFFREFHPEGAFMAYLLLVFVAGIGGFAKWFFGRGGAVWVNLDTVMTPYYPLPIALGLLALIASKREKYIIAGGLLFLAVLIHPAIGSLMMASCLLFVIFVQRHFIRAALPCIAGVIGLAVWYLLSSQQGALSYSTGPPSSVNRAILYFIGFAANYLFLIIFVVYYHFSSAKENPPIRTDFITMWFLPLLVLALSPEAKWGIFRAPYFAMVLGVPMAILASRGLATFTKRYRINAFAILIIFILLSTPSLYYRYLSPYNTMNKNVLDVVPDDIKTGLYALKDQPFGNVLAPRNITYFVPVIAEQRTAAGGLSGDQYAAFFGPVYNMTSSPETASAIFTNHSISYVVSYDDLPLQDARVIYRGDRIIVYDVNAMRASAS